MAIISVSVLLLSSAQVLSAPAGKPLPVVRTETVLALRPLIDLPEGIAIDDRGHIFVGNRRLENDTRVSEILEIALDGTVTVFATLDPAVVDDIGTGVLGLAFDSQGDLYAALASFNPRTHGVWRIRQGGEAERLRGSKQMIQPNAITFDDRGNIYVTDSAEGTVWRFTGTGAGQLWIRHEFLAPDPNFGIGANGITFIPPHDLFVANTDLGLIARVRIKQDGNPGIPEVVAAGIELLTVDGLAGDAQGHLHAVIAAAPAFGTDSLVQVNPATGEIKPSTARADAFDFPTSLAFGRGSRDHESVYIVNSGLYPEGRPDTAPGVIRVAVGVPGAQLGATSAAVADGPGELGFTSFFFPTLVTEGDRVIVARVARTNGSQGAVGVSYRTTAGTATAGPDFVASSGTLSWADGDTSDKSIEVRILGDEAAEGDEDFSVRLNDPTGGATINSLGGTKFIRIVDDDPSVGFAAGAASVGEAAGSVSLEVRRNGGSGSAVSVNYTTASGSATSGADFTAASGVLNWADGDTDAKVIAVSITSDASNESSEAFTVTLSNPSEGAVLGSTATATVTIADDDASAGGQSGGGGGGGALDYLTMLCLAFLAFPGWQWRSRISREISRSS